MSCTVQSTLLQCVCNEAYTRAVHDGFMCVVGCPVPYRRSLSMHVRAHVCAEHAVVCWSKCVCVRMHMCTHAYVLVNLPCNYSCNYCIYIDTYIVLL